MSTVPADKMDEILDILSYFNSAQVREATDAILAFGAGLIAAEEGVAFCTARGLDLLQHRSLEEDVYRTALSAAQNHIYQGQELAPGELEAFERGWKTKISWLRVAATLQ